MQFLKNIIGFMSIFSLVFINLALENDLHAASSKIDHNVNHSIEKFEVLDIPIQVNTQVTTPFDIIADALFIGPSGQKLTVPMFYNGDRTWLIRFSASVTGKWRYQTNSQMEELNNVSGTVQVIENSDPTNHGAMIIDPNNSQTFQYEDGSPYYLLAFELDWLFALDYDNDHNTPKSEHLLSLIKENGFNHVVMNVFAYDVNWTKDAKLSKNPQHEFGGLDHIFPFSGSNKEPDFSELNVKFFQKLDRSIQLLHDKRIVSHLMIYVWNKLVSWPPMNSLEDNRYFDYVIKRYGAYPNIVFDISKEALFYGRADEAYIKERIERLRKQNHYNRLITVHDFKYCSKYPDQVDFISTQDWGSEIYTRMQNVYKTFPNKPILNIEHGGYEKSHYEVWPGDYDSAEVSLRRNWMSVFAGVYSTYYWQGTSWNVIIYNPFEQPEDFIKPKFSYFKAMAQLFNEYNYANFEPIPWKNGSGYTMKDNQDTYLIYVKKENYQMSRGDWYLKPKKDGSNKRTFFWFNTLTGERTKPELITRAQIFKSPWHNKADAILVSEIVSPNE